MYMYVYVHIICMFTHTFQGQHSNCRQESSCKRPGYIPTKTQLTSPAAIDAYEKTLKAILIYKHAESYCRVRNLYSIITCARVSRVSHYSVGTHTGWSHLIISF